MGLKVGWIFIIYQTDAFIRREAEHNPGIWLRVKGPCSKAQLWLSGICNDFCGHKQTTLLLI